MLPESPHLRCKLNHIKMSSELILTGVRCRVYEPKVHPVTKWKHMFNYFCGFCVSHAAVSHQQSAGSAQCGVQSVRRFAERQYPLRSASVKPALEQSCGVFALADSHQPDFVLFESIPAILLAWAATAHRLVDNTGWQKCNSIVFRFLCKGANFW